MANLTSDALAHCFQYLDIHDVCAASEASVEVNVIARRFQFAEVQLRHESAGTLRAAIPNVEMCCGRQRLTVVSDTCRLFRP